MKDVAASVRARLLNLARAERLEFQSVLTRYGIDRLLYRLSISQHADRFAPKGAQLLLVHTVEPHRPAKDLDLLGLGSDDSDDVAQVFRDAYTVSVAPDGLEFDVDSVRAAVIRENVRYGGVRVGLTATLECTRIPLQIDVGFGDVLTPGTERIAFRVAGRAGADPPGPPPRDGRRREARDLDPVRPRDQPDEGPVRPIAHPPNLRTLGQRRSNCHQAHVRSTRHAGRSTPIGLTEAYLTDASKRAQWSAFLRRNDLQAPNLEAVVRDVAVRLAPVMPT